MYKCHECGCIFDEDDAGERRESVGEFWGSPSYQSIMVCPECDSDEIDETDEEDEEEDEDE